MQADVTAVPVVPVAAAPAAHAAGPAPDASQADAAAAAAHAAAQSQADLEQAVERMRIEFQRLQSDLRFQVDRELNRVIVSVVDAGTGQVLLQIPSEAALRVARNLLETRHGLLDVKA